MLKLTDNQETALDCYKDPLWYRINHFDWQIWLVLEIAYGHAVLYIIWQADDYFAMNMRLYWYAFISFIKWYAAAKNVYATH